MFNNTSTQAHWKTVPMTTFLQYDITLLLARFATLSNKSVSREHYLSISKPTSKNTEDNWKNY